MQIEVEDNYSKVSKGSNFVIVSIAWLSLEGPNHLNCASWKWYFLGERKYNFLFKYLGNMIQQMQYVEIQILIKCNFVTIFLGTYLCT